MEILKGKVQMSSKYMKRYSTSLAIDEIEIKIVLSFLLIPFRMAIFMGNNTNKCWQGCHKTGCWCYCP
jgi:hypothetical protein